MAALTASRVGLTFTIGGVAALIAFVLGITLVRPAMKRASALAEVVESARTDEERAAPAAEAQRLRARGATAGRVATWLLLLAVAAMAVARYV
jgi:hypothetical protein